MSRLVRCSLFSFAFVISFTPNMGGIVKQVAAQSSETSWKANPDLVEKLGKQRSEFNYDEARVPEYTLPDPLRMSGGGAVSTAAQWNEVRRGELMELFRANVFGRRPEVNFAIRFELQATIADALDGSATGKSYNAIVSFDGREFSFPFVVFVPNRTTGKVPAIVLINNRSFISLETAAKEHDPFWPVKTIIDQGYATASFYTSDVDPDRADGYDEGIRSFLAKGQPPADDAWRSLSAWGWAASRILDYLELAPEVDASRVALVGHSRGGKTALWGASEDPRFAIAYSNNSGCGGAALSRRAYGETVGRITKSFPHWFCPAFATYAGRENELPIDSHELISLVAPRAVYVTSADEDLWADPRGEYLALVAAAPVFQLLGTSSIDQAEMPGLDDQRIVGKTGYHIRPGGHGLEQADWDYFLKFANGILKK